MHIEYTTLTSNDKYVVDFNYSVVSSTPGFGMKVFKHSAQLGRYEDVPYMTQHADGIEAIKEIRKHLERCQEFTTLHDK